MQESKQLHQALGEFRTYLKTINEKLEQIIAHQERGKREPEPVDLKLQKKLRCSLLGKKFGTKDYYTHEEICEMHKHFLDLESVYEEAYHAGLVKRDGQYCDGTPAGLRN